VVPCRETQLSNNAEVNVKVEDALEQSDAAAELPTFELRVIPLGVQLQGDLITAARDDHVPDHAVMAAVQAVCDPKDPLRTRTVCRSPLDSDEYPSSDSFGPPLRW